MKINYPNGIIKETKTCKIINTRGMMLEDLLNKTNEYYLIKGIANIHKKPTPIQVVRVNYPERSKAKITEAYYKTPSTTDYNGIYKGKYIDFEAKETNDDRFYFSNIHDHQVKHLLSIDSLGGIGFVIIMFKAFNEVYIIDIKEFNKYYSDSKVKALKIELIKEIGVKVNQTYTKPIDYLTAVDELYFK